MLCDSKKNSPDKILHKWLVYLGYALAMLGVFVVLFMLFPELYLFWMGGVILFTLGSLMLVFKSLVAGEKAINYGGFASALIETDYRPQRLEDAKGNPMLFNNMGKEFFGEGNVFEKLVDNAIIDEATKNALTRLRTAYENLISEVIDVPLKMNKKDGGEEINWYRISVRPIFLRQVKLFGSLSVKKIKKDAYFLWSARDITAKKNLNDIFVQERKSVLDFLDYLPVGLYLLNDKKEIDYVNVKFAKWMGMEREDLMKRKISDMLVDGNEHDRDYWQGELYFKDDLGNVFSAMVFYLKFIEDGIYKTRAVVVRDVASGGDVRDELEIYKDKINWLFDRSPIGICFVDGSGKISKPNHVIADFLNTREDELIGKNILSFIKSEDKKVLDSNIKDVEQGRRNSVICDIHLDSDVVDKELVVSTCIIPCKKKYSAKGDVSDGLIIYFTDATKEKSLELQFAQAQKMQAMGQLAGGVAHDFNNLLTAMIGFSDLLLQRHSTGDPSFADIMQIKTNANRAAGLVKQLLAFSRQQPLRPEMIDVTENFAELNHMLNRVISEKIKLKYIHGNNLGFVKVDPVQFSQVIMNLVVNARDAILENDESGEVTITTSVAKIDEPTVFGSDTVPAGEFVVIDVRDSGCGISEENLSRIFEPFFSTKTNVVGSGTGLGLATVYGIVRQTDGFIKVDSKLGVGTTFSIHLPRYDEKIEMVKEEIKETENKPIMDRDEKIILSVEKRDEKIDNMGLNFILDAPKISADKEDGEIANVKILFVEDEDAVRAFGCRALKNRGYEVTECNSGENAVEALENDTEFDLLITDMVMPGMDGAKLSRIVREKIPNIKIILMSGYSEDIAKNGISENDDYEFMAKPFSLDVLANRVKNILKSS